MKKQDKNHLGEIKMKRKYYAVKKGKKPGIYRSWEECRAQVSGFSGASVSYTHLTLPTIRLV